MRMYEIVAELRELVDSLEETGELNEHQAQMLDTLNMSFEDKARNIVASIRELKAEGEAVKDEAQRIAKLAKSKEGAADRLREYLKYQMETLGCDKLKLDIATVSLQKASRPKIFWFPAEPIPEEFQRVTVVLDGDKAYQAFKDGSLPNGFKVEYTKSLVIR